MKCSCIVTWEGWPIPFGGFFSNVGHPHSILVHSKTAPVVQTPRHSVTFRASGYERSPQISGSDSFLSSRMTIIHYSLNNVISLSRIKNKSLDKNKEWQTAARCQPVKKYSRSIQARGSFRLKRQSTIPSNPGCFQSEMNSTTLALYVDVWFWLKRLSGRNAGACKARSFSTVNVRLDLPPATIRRCDLFISLYDRECFKWI